MAFGVSFLPDEQADDNGELERSRGASFQKAIQLLQLRLPRVVGGGGIAPASLLGAPGGMGMGGQPENSAFAQAILKMAGMGRPQAPMGGAAPMAGGPKPPMSLRPQTAAGTPRIVPGITPGATAAPSGAVQKAGQDAMPPPPEPTPAPSFGGHLGTLSVPQPGDGYTGNVPFSKWRNQFGGGGSDFY